MKKWKSIIDKLNEFRDSREFIQTFGVFDIETTIVNIKQDETIKKHAILYSWQFCVEDQYIFGRSWSTYRAFIKYLKLNLKGKKFMIFVHNLGYDGKFISSAFNISDDHIFAKVEKNGDPWESNVWYKLEDDNIQYRCSYALTGKSLAELTKGLEYEKLDNFDHSKKRFPWTDLTEQEEKYLEHDVRGLSEALHLFLADYTISERLPRTEHGIVRRKFETAYRDARKNKELSRDDWEDETVLLGSMRVDSVKQLTYDQFKFAYKAARGGNFYASRRYIGKIVDNVTDPDGKSEYPSVLLTEKFPVGRWRWKKEVTLDDLIDMPKRGLAWIATIKFHNIELKDPNYGFPYIEATKTTDNVYAKRLLKTSEHTCTITNVDFDIINGMYTYNNLEVIQCMTSELDYLPKWFTSLILEHFSAKEQAKTKAEREKAKVLLNAITGALAMNFYKYYEDSADGYRAYCGSHNWYNYSWYIFMTAYARKNLQAVIDLDEPNCIYVAADSVKVKNGIKLKKFNDLIVRKCKAQNAFVKVGSKLIYPGVWEAEHIFTKFVTIGTSRYCGEICEPIKLKDKKTIECARNEYGFIDEDFKKFNIMAVTSGGDPLKIALDIFKRGGIEEFKNGTQFKLSYKAHTTNRLAEPLKLFTNDGHEFELTSNIVIEETETVYSLETSIEIGYNNVETKELSRSDWED